jgi:hypothetical protein
MTTKPTHGGKRPNAGRKPGTPRQSLTIRLSEPAMARLASLRESTSCGSGKLIEAMILQLETENDGQRNYHNAQKSS